MKKWLILTCALGLVACGGESGDDPSAGTGILGGNPLTIAFESEEEPDDTFGLASFADLQIHYGKVRFGYLDEQGACVLEEEFSELEQVVGPGQRGIVQVSGDDGYPCAMNVRPPDGQALVTATIVTGVQDVEVALSEESGFIIDVDPIEVAEDENPEVVAILSVDQVLTGYDVTALIAAASELTRDGSEGANRFLAAMEGAVTVYRDPTPGDGVMELEQRVEANVSGNFRFE